MPIPCNPPIDLYMIFKEVYGRDPNPGENFNLDQLVQASNLTDKTLPHDMLMFLCYTHKTGKWIPDESTAYCETQSVVLNEFDYMVIRFIWVNSKQLSDGTTVTGTDANPINGTDLDIAVGFRQTNTTWDNKYVGYWQQPQSKNTLPNDITPKTDAYLWWASDSVGGSGVETVLIGMDKFLTDHPSTPNIIEIPLYMHWYDKVADGRFNLQFATYKGGTMSQQGTDIINTGGTLTNALNEERVSIKQSKNTIVNSTDYDLVALLQYDRTLKTGSLII
jgi:hypothetical protein